MFGFLVHKRDTPGFILCFHKHLSRFKNAENGDSVGKIGKNSGKYMAPMTPLEACACGACHPWPWYGKLLTCVHPPSGTLRAFVIFFLHVLSLLHFSI